MLKNKKKVQVTIGVMLVSLLCLLQGLLFFVPAKAQAQAFPLGVFVLSEAFFSVEEETMYVNCGVTITNLESMRETLRDGAQLQLSGTFTFYRARGAWVDAKMTSGEFASIIRYNQLTQEFEVVLPEETVPLFKHKRLENVLTKTWHQLRLPLVPAQQIKAVEEYYVQIKLSLRHTDVPPWVTKGLLFWSWEVVPDKTARYNFSLTSAQEVR